MVFGQRRIKFENFFNAAWLTMSSIVVAVGEQKHRMHNGVCNNNGRADTIFQILASHPPFRCKENWVFRLRSSWEMCAAHFAHMKKSMYSFVGTT